MIQKNQNITLLTTNALGFPPFVFHQAIKFYGTDNHALVIHRSTSGVEIVDYNAFMKGRHIIRKKIYKVTHPFDPYYIQMCDNKPFDWMNNNCEDFASEMIERTTDKRIYPKSMQRVIWIAIFAIILAVLIYFKR